MSLMFTIAYLFDKIGQFQVGQFYQYNISEIQSPPEGLLIPSRVSQAVPYLQCFMMVFTSPNLLLPLSLKTKPITQNPAVPLPHQTLSVFNVIKSPTAVIDRKKKKSLGKYVGHSKSQNPIQTSAALLKPDVYLTGQF